MATVPPETPAGAPSAPMDDHDALPAGTRFGELEILKVLGIGGFGIVYLAMDHALEREVALKEYMPGSLAGRGKGQMVSIRSGAHTETYALGLRSFVNEARLLARFNHPSLVKVYRFWEENGTAYMVMPFLQGRTLRDVRRSMTETPTEPWIRSVINPILDALELLHREGVYHRDIAPDNILLPPGELPVLLDFGAARRAIGDHTQTFTAILKPSYAPIEQYAEVVQLRQGPWTDLYALGAVVFYLLRGSPPPPATARAVQDDVPLLIHEDYPALSEHFISAIDWALAIRPSDRPQNIAALREVFDGRQPAPPRVRAGFTIPPNRGGFGVAPGAPVGTETASFAPTMRVTGQATEVATARMDRGLTRPDPPRTDAPQIEPTRVDPPRVDPIHGRPIARANPTRAEPTRANPTRVEPTRPVTAGPRAVAADRAVDQTVLTRPPGGTQASRSVVDDDDQVTLPPPMPAPAPVPPPPKAAPVAPPVVEPAPASRRGLWVGAIGAVVLLGAGAAYMAANRSTAPVVPSPVATASQPGEGAVPAPAPLPPPVTATVTAPPAVSVAPSSVSPSAVATVTLPPTIDPRSAKGSASAAVPAAGPLTAAASAAAAAAAAAASKAKAAKDLLARPAPRPDGALVPLPEQRIDRPQASGDDPSARSTAGARGQPVPPPPAVVQQGPMTPRDACGGRVFLALAVCMEEQCEQPRFRAHPQCEPVRQMVERRRRNEN
jgi:hypothetical protein